MSGLGKSLYAFIDPLHTLPGHTSYFAGARQPARAQTPADAPAAGTSTKMNPGQTADLISTSPQGILNPSQSAKQTLLGG